MGTELPAYYRQQNNTSQAQQQAGYTGQAGIQAANNTSQAYLQSTRPGGQNYVPQTTTNQQVYNPLGINYYPGIMPSYQGYDLSSMYADNPFSADYTNLGIFNDTNIWNSYPDASNYSVAGSYNYGTPSGTVGSGTSQTATQTNPRQLYQTIMPVGDISSFQVPTGSLGGRFYTQEGNPYYVSYSATPSAGASAMNTLGYDPTTFINGMASNALVNMGYSPTDYSTLLNQVADPYESLWKSYQEQTQGLNNAISQITNAMSQAMTPEEQTTTSTTPVSSTGFDLPAGFRSLPMPAEYYGFAAAAQNNDTTNGNSWAPQGKTWTDRDNEAWIKFLSGKGLDTMTYDDYMTQYGPWGWEDMNGYIPLPGGGWGSSPYAIEADRMRQENQASGRLKYDPKRGYYYAW